MLRPDTAFLAAGTAFLLPFVVSTLFYLFREKVFEPEQGVWGAVPWASLIAKLLCLMAPATVIFTILGPILHVDDIGMVAAVTRDNEWILFGWMLLGSIAGYFAWFGRRIILGDPKIMGK